MALRRTAVSAKLAPKSLTRRALTPPPASSVSVPRTASSVSAPDGPCGDTMPTLNTSSPAAPSTVVVVVALVPVIVSVSAPEPRLRPRVSTPS